MEMVPDETRHRALRRRAFRDAPGTRLLQTKKSRHRVTPRKAPPCRLFPLLTSQAMKKADVLKPGGFHRVGLLLNSPAIYWLAIYLVVRIP